MSTIAVVKQGLLDWPGNDGKTTSHSNFNLRFSERLYVVVRSVLFQFDVV